MGRGPGHQASQSQTLFMSVFPLVWWIDQDAFVKIVRHEGTRTLWSGLPATL